MFKLRMKLAGYFIYWGISLIPHPVIRAVVDQYVGAAGVRIDEMLKEAQEKLNEAQPQD